MNLGFFIFIFLVRAIGSGLQKKIWRAANTAPFAIMVARLSLQQRN
jgi:hypothetical protein